MPHTCESLNLDLDAAKSGRTWMLLPEGYRDEASGMTYPLPTSRKELAKLVEIPTPPFKKDCGCVYLHRASQLWLRKPIRRKIKPIDAEEQRRVHNAYSVSEHFKRRMKKVESEARLSAEQVHRAAAVAVASLTTLFELGRQVIDGQLQAHLSGEEWKGEKISASAARECFRMVTQAVKGFGLKTDQVPAAQETIMREAAEAIKATQEAIALAPRTEDEREH